MTARGRTLFASFNLIGDTLAQTPALRAYRAAHPNEEVHWLVQDDAMRPLLEGMPAAGVCDAIVFEKEWDRIRSMAYDGYAARVLMDVQEAFRIGSENHLHIAQAYGRMLGVNIAPDDVLPTVPLRKDDLDAVDVPEHCLVMSPRSVSNDPINKTLPWHAVAALADRFRAAGRIDDHVVLLREQDPPPELPVRVMRLSLSHAAAYVAKACARGGAYCGVDNGITHIASGLRVPTFCVYPAGMWEGWTGYTTFAHYRIAKTRPELADVDAIWDAWNTRLD